MNDTATTYRIVDDNDNIIDDLCNLTEQQAEMLLCRVINNGHDAYIQDEEPFEQSTPNDPSNDALLPYVVLYTSDDFNVPEGALFMAEDSDHAEDQMYDETPDAVITWIVQTNDINHAFDVYHQESSLEEAG